MHIYVNEYNINEDITMTWYIMCVDGDDYDEPRLIVNVDEEAESIYDELKEYIEGRDDFRDRVEWFADEMTDALGYVREEVILGIADALRYEENEEVYGIGFVFDDDGWGRADKPIGIHF